MLEKPDVRDADLRACLREQYALHPTAITFLPVGNDVHTAVYRVVADDATPYFLKVHSGPFDVASVAIPHFLHNQGIAPIIPPIATRGGQLWTRMDAFAVMLFPFIEGVNGFATSLSRQQWVALGGALKMMHMAVVPPSLSAAIPHERYSPYWRDLVRMFQARVESSTFSDPVAAQLAAFLHANRDEIAQIVGRAETLGDALRARSLDQVLCHADIHGGNVLIGTDGALFIVDWDTLVFAPRERDLMFVGSGIFGVWHDRQEEGWFYQGYGQAEVDVMALAYYRYERIVEDIAAYGEQLLLTDEGGADRAHALRYFLDQFLPNNVVAIAHATDRLLDERHAAPPSGKSDRRRRVR
jgi:spectinomycin phosphotransferase